MLGLRRGAQAFTLALSMLWLLGGNALAVDVLGGGAIRDTAAGYAYRWSGLYAGVHAGYATGTTDADFPLIGLPSSDISFDGALYGGHLGYNWRFGSTVVGIEGSFSGSSISGSSGCIVVMSCEREVDWLGTVQGRFGYVMDRALIYATAGVAWSEVSTTVSQAGCTCLEGSDINVGWLLGLGVEYAITSRLAGRIEFIHVDLGSRTHTLEPPGGGFPESARVAGTLDTLRLGASLKLGD